MRSGVGGLIPLPALAYASMVSPNPRFGYYTERMDSTIEVRRFCAESIEKPETPEAMKPVFRKILRTLDIAEDPRSGTVIRHEALTSIGLQASFVPPEGSGGN